MFWQLEKLLAHDFVIHFKDLMGAAAVNEAAPMGSLPPLSRNLMGATAVMGDLQP